MAVQLETSRLILRQFEISDAPYIFELNSDPDVIRYTGDKPFNNVNEALSFVKNYGDYQNYNRGRLSVFIKETGEYIGWCGLKYLPAKNETDIGYRFLKRYWGKGFATEAAAACIDDGFERLNLHNIIGTAMKDNIASINVFHKLGLNYTFDEDCGCQPGVVYNITSEEWESAKIL